MNGASDHPPNICRTSVAYTCSTDAPGMGENICRNTWFTPVRGNQCDYTCSTPSGLLFLHIPLGRPENPTDVPHPTLTREQRDCMNEGGTLARPHFPCSATPR